MGNSHYKARFKNKRIKFGKLLTFENQVFIYPSLKTERQKRIFREIEFLGRTKKLNKNILKFIVSKIRYLDGNLINEWTGKTYKQFREFFVQQVKLNSQFKHYADTLFMNRKKPIFKDQPIVKPDNFGDYWMNTPLQTIDN